MHKVTAKLVDNLKEARQYPFRDRGSKYSSRGVPNMNPREIEQVKKFASDKADHHYDRADEHAREADTFTRSSEPYHAHVEASHKNQMAGDHYTNLQNKPQRTHDDLGGKRMMQHSDSANEASKRAYAAADMHIPDNADEDDGVRHYAG